MPMEGKGVLARWDRDEQSMRMWSPTQTSTGKCAPRSRRLEPPLARIHCIAPDVGGGFGVKIVHPWAEELLVPWRPALGRDVKWTEDRREHFISSAHERAQLQEVTVGFDDDGVVLGLDVKVWHDNGAYTPTASSSRSSPRPSCWGPKPGAYRCEFWSLYTNTVIVTPYRGAGRPQGCSRWSARWMRSRRTSAGPRRRARGELHPPEEMPYDHGLMFQDGRPQSMTPATSRPAWPSSRRSWAGTTSRHTGRRPRPRAQGGPGDRLLRRGHGRRAL